MLITVPEAAKRVGRDPETVRRWIRSGKLRSQKAGTQHLIEEDDLLDFFEDTLPVPPEWETTSTGEPVPDVVALIRRSRASH